MRVPAFGLKSSLWRKLSFEYHRSTIYKDTSDRVLEKADVHLKEADGHRWAMPELRCIHFLQISAGARWLLREAVLCVVVHRSSIC